MGLVAKNLNGGGNMVNTTYGALLTPRLMILFVYVFSKGLSLVLLQSGTLNSLVESSKISILLQWCFSHTFNYQFAMKWEHTSLHP